MPCRLRRIWCFPKVLQDFVLGLAFSIVHVSFSCRLWKALLVSNQSMNQLDTVCSGDKEKLDCGQAFEHPVEVMIFASPLDFLAYHTGEEKRNE